MSNLFNSIFNDTTATANPIQLFLALLVSLILGLALTWAYKHRTLYTREFAVSLTLLPCLMTLVIFLVNGSRDRLPSSSYSLHRLYLSSMASFRKATKQEQSPTSQTINHHNCQPRKATPNYPIWAITILY